METTPIQPVRRWFIIAALAALSTLASVTAAQGATEYRIEGGGWGHGVGMSQYGAYGMALLDGADAAEILGHYYTGTSLGRFGDGLVAPGPLWVNLISEASQMDLQAKAISAGGTDTTISFGGETLTLPAGSSMTVTSAGGGNCTVTVGASSHGPAPCHLDLTWDGWEATPTTLLQVDAVTFPDLPTPIGCTHMDWNATPATARPCQYARGSLHVRPDNDTDTVHLVLEIDVEHYMLGISEMPYHWGTSGGQPALEAQAIAARSYATHRQGDIGDPATRTSCWCHVMDSTLDQRYVGWGHGGAGQGNWIDAVRDTAGVVVTHPSETKGGVPIPIEAFYFSSTFGRTEPSVVGFGREVPYLQSVDDRWAIDPAVGNSNATWSRTLGAAQIGDLLGLSSDVTGITAVSCSTSGAASELRVDTANGNSVTFLSRHLRTPLGLRSPQITAVNGAGFCANASGPPPTTTTTTTTTSTTTTTTTSPATVPPTVAAVIVDDNPSGDSIGNDDGIAQCGETVELDVMLATTGTLEGVTATLTVTDALVTLLHNASSDYPAAAGGTSTTNSNDWDLQIAAATPDQHTVGLSLEVADAAGATWTLPVELVVACATAVAPAAPTVSAVVVDDGVLGDSVGNGDATAQCGETIELYVDLHNPGVDRLTGVSASLSGGVLYNSASTYGDLAAGTAGRNTNDWDIVVGPNDLALALTVTADQGGPWELAVAVDVSCAADVAVASVTVDDGVYGDSVGNNDKVAHCGETIELYVAITGPEGLAVSAELVGTSSGISLLYNRSAAYPPLDPDVAQENFNDWDLRIADDAGPSATLTIDFTTAGGARWSRDVELPIACAVVGVTTVTVDDGVFGDSIGNNDKAAHCGETIELYVALRNETSETLTGLVATLEAPPSGAVIKYNTTSGYGDLPPGGIAENTADWDIAIGADAPPSLEFTLTVMVAGTPYPLAVAVPVGC